MKTTLLSVLAFGACASVALAEPLPPAGNANESASAEAPAAGPVALTEAEMDRLAAGYRSSSSFTDGGAGSRLSLINALAIELPLTA